MGDSLLPYGDTLHYPTCGCPPGWQNNTRAADIVDLLAQQAFKGYQAGRLVATRPLRVLYFLPHHNVTGGMKCLVEHIRLLKIRGTTYDKSCLWKGHSCSDPCDHIFLASCSSC